MSTKKASYILDGSTKIPINDSSIPEWAKQPSKPSYTASEIGAAAESTTSANISEHGWYRIAESRTGVNCIGLFKIIGRVSGRQTVALFGAASSFGKDSSINVFQKATFSGYDSISKVRMVVPKSYNSNKAYLEVFAPENEKWPVEITITLSTSFSWTLVEPSLVSDEVDTDTNVVIEKTFDVVLPVDQGGTGAKDAVSARTNLSAVGFVKGEFSSLEAFWDAATASGNYNDVLCANVRFKDTTGWGPLGTANIWYQGIISWQNNPNHETYDTAGVCILWRGSTAASTLYRGSINGNFTNGITSKWFQVYDGAVNVPIESGGTGADTAKQARTNLELNPVSLYSGNLSTGSIKFEYGKYNFYLIIAKISTVARSTLLVPTSQIATSALAWQLGIGTNGAYLPLSLVHDNTNVTLTVTENSKGTVTQVWGFN